VKLARTHRLILYALGRFYHALNQPLVEKPVRVRTSKIAFIEHVLNSGVLVKQKRALYKNLEVLEKKKLITYEKHMIKFTDRGLLIREKIEKEMEKFIMVDAYFHQAQKPKRKLQTVIKA
jgi:hypothetical protein